MTNFEKIKSMTVEKMATYLCSKELPICPLQVPHCRDDNCPECFKEWLESEVQEDE